MRNKTLTVMLTLDDIRRAAVTNTLFKPTTLERAINKLGFVQADPIRAPARAQDLTLRHRVKNYRAGDLERRYATLDIEEDFFINYGFLPRATHALMHPRTPRTVWDAATHKRADAIAEFVQHHGSVHPRDVEQHFAHGRAVNDWGGTSNASTKMLNDMHYRGLVRVGARDNGIRLYAPPIAVRAEYTPAERDAALDRLVDIVIQKYAPIPASGFASLVGRLRYGVPHWRTDVAAAIKRAKARLAHTRIAGVDWYWPQTLKISAAANVVADDAGDGVESNVENNIDNSVRLLTPFDPIVWDRKRFQMLWGWAYRFEAYTPAPKRKLGYYALPLLWRTQVIGWGSISVSVDVNMGASAAVKKTRMSATFGYVTGRAPRDPLFKHALNEECERMRLFLGAA